MITIPRGSQNNDILPSGLCRKPGVAGIAFAMLRAVSVPPVKIICFTLQSQKHRRAEHNGTIAMQSLQCLAVKTDQKEDVGS